MDEFEERGQEEVNAVDEPEVVIYDMPSSEEKEYEFDTASAVAGGLLTIGGLLIVKGAKKLWNSNFMVSRIRVPVKQKIASWVVPTQLPQGTEGNGIPAEVVAAVNDIPADAPQNENVTPARDRTPVRKNNH